MVEWSRAPGSVLRRATARASPLSDRPRHRERAIAHGCAVAVRTSLRHRLRSRDCRSASGRGGSEPSRPRSSQAPACGARLGPHRTAHRRHPRSGPAHRRASHRTAGHPTVPGADLLPRRGDDGSRAGSAGLLRRRLPDRRHRLSDDGCRLPATRRGRRRRTGRRRLCPRARASVSGAVAAGGGGAGLAVRCGALARARPQPGGRDRDLGRRQHRGRPDAAQPRRRGSPSARPGARGPRRRPHRRPPRPARHAGDGHPQRDRPSRAALGRAHVSAPSRGCERGGCLTPARGIPRRPAARGDPHRRVRPAAR